MDYIKLRLGFVTGRGQQKGVDSLIVTDLIDLARNRAITDAVMLSGDEDIRIGVQIAQSFGVRVHLIGIAPSRGSQSLQLLRESDTTTEWDATAVSKFLSIKPPMTTAIDPALAGLINPAAATVPQTATPTASAPSSETMAVLTVVANSVAASLDSSDIAALKTYWLTSKGIPHELDGKLLARSRVQVGRNLDTAEKRYVRSKFIAILQGN
jgi:hypothetical protein